VKSISRIFLAGLITLLPVVLTVYLVYALVMTMENLLGGLLRLILPEHWYLPGLGVVAGLAVVFAVGVLMRAYVVQWLFAKAETLVYHVPLIKTVYRSIRDFFEYFSPARKKEFQQVVAVTLGDTGMQAVGFVTQTRTELPPGGFGQGDSVLVYLPMSYMIGGHTVLVPRSAVRPLDMGMEEAVRFTLTAGVTGTRDKPA
jgi:uncharacterized membrane protein